MTNETIYRIEIFLLKKRITKAINEAAIVL